MGRRASVLFAAAWFLMGCEGAVRRTLPDAVHAIAVMPFVNLSDQPLLPAVLDEEIRRAFRLDGRVAIAEQTADANALLAGTIAVYGKDAVRYDANNIVQEYRLHCSLDLTLTDPVTTHTLWLAASAVPPQAGLAPDVSASAAMPPGATPARPPAAPGHRVTRTVNFTVVPASGLPVETEADAQRRAVRDLAQDIVHRVIEGF